MTNRKITSWEYDDFIIVARQCKSLSEFRLHKHIYNQARLKGFLPKMKETLRSLGIWTNPLYITEEICEKEALKYTRRIDFMRGSSGIYGHAMKAGILDRICQHMEPQGNLYWRQLYLIEFPDKVGYVGLAANPKDRLRRHFNKKDDPVRVYFEKTGEPYTLNIISGFTEQKEASEKERELIMEYRDKGYTLLNRSKGGERGYSSNPITNEELIQIARQYKRRGEFQKKNKKIYQLAMQRGILEQACAHMPVNATIKYTEEKIREVCESVESFRELHDKDIRVYDILAKNHRQADFFIKDGQRWVKKPLKPFYTIEQLQQEASKYSSRKEFQEKGTKYYNYACRHHILEEVCKCLPKRKKVESKYTIEIIDKIVSECSNITELQKKYKGVYKAIVREHLEGRYFVKEDRHIHLKKTTQK